MKIYANGSRAEITRGQWLENSTGVYRFTGRMRNDCLYYVRKYNISINGNCYPVKGEAGLYSWTASEVIDAIIKP